jgi:trimeric autotransporter adhesin
VFALAVFDDGSGAGPQLYAGGGGFTLSGDSSTTGLAKWDGSSWQPVGIGPLHVESLAVFDDGSGPALYAGGFFTDIGAVKANNIAKWNGTRWSALGSGVSGLPVDGSFEGVRTFAVFDDGSGAGQRLYAGGEFLAAGGVAVASLACWDGAHWADVGGGTDREVRSLAVFDDGSGSGPALYVGGWYVLAGGLPSGGIAKWDGSSWSALSGQQNIIVDALQPFDAGDGSGPALFVEGSFQQVSGKAASCIARWDGAAWSTLGSGIDHRVDSLAVAAIGGESNALYAGGNFTSVGGLTATNIARWDGTRWSALGTGMNGTLSNSVKALAAFDSGDGAGTALYACGRFTLAGGVAALNIARWDGADWSPLGTGMQGFPRALAVFDDGGGAALYVGGGVSTTDGVTAKNVAKWDGSKWSPLGAGLNSGINDFVVFDSGDGRGPALYAGGSFTTAGGQPANHIASWDGTSWSSRSGAAAR